jgi:L-methionine (R)-S-oxide reductase
VKAPKFNKKKQGFPVTTLGVACYHVAGDAGMKVLDSSKVIRLLQDACAQKAGRNAILQLAADTIRASGPPYTSVYLYMLHEDMLVLEAFSGRETGHKLIPMGKGVCGTAVASGEDQNIGDVRAVGNYLACNIETRSELVVLIRQHTRILGQIDIDSDTQGPFPPQEQHEVKRIADALTLML